MGISTPKIETRRHRAIASSHVVPDQSRCVQCGICNFNCPIGLDIRRHAWLGQHIEDSHCLTCGECVKRCPRGVLQLEMTELFSRRKP